MLADLSNLFDESGSETVTGKTVPTQCSDKYTPQPPRGEIGLCGIHNQGATCYLNSLLQSLYMTPEFREALFNIGESELGKLNDKGNSNVRVIPLELQRLFGRLLLLDARATSTTRLTDSFGWTDNEQLVQHDVQELNRILFSAIDDSLVGTSGEKLLHELYHGVVVNKITCQSCGQISEREEDFLDLCTAVTDVGSLEEALNDMYVNAEILDGKNQYRCDGCQKLVNAKKGACIRHLPPVLSISLLRFSFDVVKMERYKETGKFSFPLSIDMAQYCENLTTAGNTEYDLFSVIIHRGSTHGGHYHAYIRDVDALGSWIDPEDSPITISASTDVIDIRYPQQLLATIVKKTSPNGLTIDKLGAEIANQTGVSWNKRFKQKYGPITKFIKKHDDIFEFNPASSWVSLKTDKPIVVEKCKTDLDNKSRPAPPDPGECWFDFDDSRISAVNADDITKQFSGKESAYMLFYRSRALTRPVRANRKAANNISDELVAEVICENETLEVERKCHEVQLNMISVQLHFSRFFTVTSDGSLHASQGACFIDVEVDKRESMVVLRSKILELAGELLEAGDDFVLHLLLHQPTGWHMFNRIDTDLNMHVQEAVENGACLLVWDGKQIGGSSPVHMGASNDNKPTNEMATGDVGTTKKVDEIRTSMQEVSCVDAVEQSNGCSSDRLPTDNNMTLSVENRTMSLVEGGYPVLTATADEHISVAELKAFIMSLYELPPIQDGGRLRLEDNSHGLLPPIKEHQSLQDAGIKNNMRLVLEAGLAPSTSQMTLTFTCAGHDEPVEVMVEQRQSVAECLQCMLKAVGLSGDTYHLRKTNWCGEMAEILDDEDEILEKCGLRDGSHLLVMDGKLPPKGYVKLCVWLLPSAGPDGYLQNTESRFLGDQTLSKFSTLHSLKEQILLDLPHVPSVDFLRVRIMENKIATSVLHGDSQTLQRLKVANHSDIGVQVLLEEERLQQTSLVLTIRERQPESRTYGRDLELVCDVQTVIALRQAIAELLVRPIEHVALAKHLPNQYKWLQIVESAQSNKKQQKGKKKPRKPTIRQDPFHLKDGDTIGVKDMLLDQSTDFSTVEDDKGLEKLKREAEEKARSRAEKKQFDLKGGGDRQKRPEVGIKIHVGDFR